jgi:hypothetical protein
VVYERAAQTPGACAGAALGEPPSKRARRCDVRCFSGRRSTFPSALTGVDRERQRPHRRVYALARRPSSMWPISSLSGRPNSSRAFLADRGYPPRGVPLVKHVLALAGQCVRRSGVVITIDAAE